MKLAELAELDAKYEAEDMTGPLTREDFEYLILKGTPTTIWWVGSTNSLISYTIDSTSTLESNLLLNCSLPSGEKTSILIGWNYYPYYLNYWHVWAYAQRFRK